MAANNLSYSLKVCLASVVLAPAGIIGVDSLLLGTTYQDAFLLLQPSMLIALEVCVPIWLVFYLVTRYINKERFFYINKKMILAAVGVFLIFLPQMIILFLNSGYFITYSVVDLMQPLIHAAILVIGVLTLNLKPADEPLFFYGDYKEEKIKQSV